MKRIAITTLTSILFMGWCLFQASANAATGVTAQEQMPQNQDLPRESDGRPIEEIEVIGQRSSIQLRMEIERLEEGMFDLFNELNSSDELDVTCHKITPTGTLIPTWECEPAYLTRARAQNAQDFINLGVPLKDDAELMFFNRVKTEQLNVEIRELALDHPELAAAMLELDAKKQGLVEREQRLREERGFFGLFTKKDKE